MITLSDALPGDAAAVAALDEFYGSLPEGVPAERAAQVRDVLFGNPPLAHALVAWDGEAPAGFAAYSSLWPAAGLTASLYLKELYVAEAYRRTGVDQFLMGGLYDVARRRGLSRVEWTTDTSNVGAPGVLRVARRQAARVQDLLPRSPLSG
jgi:GNAT superfamily N-acetyltransferase